jgi:Pvc16 N-terminal domain
VAGWRGISAAAKSIEGLLNAHFALDPPIVGRNAKAILARTDDFQTGTGQSLIVAPTPTISIFLYRIDFNKTMRAAWSAVGSQDGRMHLPLDLHLLLTAWADNAEHEYQILGAAMQILEATPILSGPRLDPAGDWATNDAIQVLLDDMSTETLVQTFDALAADFRLSVPYVARVVRIDADTPRSPDVTTVVTGLAPSTTP